MFEEENAVLIMDSALQWKGQIGADVTVFLPLGEWGLLSTAALKIQLQISYLPVVFNQVEAALEEGCVISEMVVVGGDPGLAEPCSLSLRRGGVGCEELNRQSGRGGDIQFGQTKPDNKAASCDLLYKNVVIIASKY